MQLFAYVRQCLSTEMRLIQAAGGEGPSGMPMLGAGNAGADILHKLDVLRRRSQVEWLDFFIVFL